MDAVVAATIVAAAEAANTIETPNAMNPLLSQDASAGTRSTRTQSAKLALANQQNSGNNANESSSNNHQNGSKNKNRNFLDNVPEDEKRIRMRYLPNVDGIRGLHKSEIKSDLKAARMRPDSNKNGAVIIEEDAVPSAQELLANPSVAASITCYNPPVLPESTAEKKNERIRKWAEEKSVRAIEVNNLWFLNAYILLYPSLISDSSVGYKGLPQDCAADSR